MHGCESCVCGGCVGYCESVLLGMFGVVFGLAYKIFFFLMIRRPPRSTQSRSSAASDVYKRQALATAHVVK